MAISTLFYYAYTYYTHCRCVYILIHLYTFTIRYRSPLLNRNLSKPVFNILTTLMGGHNYDLSEMYTYILHDLSLKQLFETHLLFTNTLWYECLLYTTTCICICLYIYTLYEYVV